MAKAGWLPLAYRADPNEDRKTNFMVYEMDNNYPIYWTVADGTKREMIDFGEE